MDEDELILKLVLAELVDELGGRVELDANSLMRQAQSGSNKGIRMAFEDDQLVIEILREQSENTVTE
jgi:hypothetical protein